MLARYVEILLSVAAWVEKVRPVVRLVLWNIDVEIATDASVVVIVAIVPDADADVTVGSSAIDIDDSAVAVASPAVEDAAVAAAPFPDFGRNYWGNLASQGAAAEHLGPDSNFAAATDRVDAKQVANNNSRFWHRRHSDYYYYFAVAGVNVEHPIATAAAAVVAVASFSLAAAAPHSSFSFRSSFASYSSAWSTICCSAPSA